MSKCEISARKYGTAFLRYIANTGMNRTRTVMSECAGPRCERNGICSASASMSASGMMVKVSSIGMLVLVLSSFAERAPMMYPVARCPTANDWISSVYSEERT